MNNKERSRLDREPRSVQKREREDGEQRPKQRGTGYGRERAAYLEYLARKWKGSAPPTAEAYAKALRLWRQLPGAVITEPTDLGSRVEPTPPSGQSTQHTAAKGRGREGES